MHTLGIEKILFEKHEVHRKRIVETQLVELFAKKLSAAGIAPSQRLKARFRKWFRTDGKGTFHFSDPLGKEGTATNLEFTPREVRNLRARVDRRTIRAAEKGALAVVKAAPKILRPLFDQSWPTQRRQYERTMHGFHRRLLERYSTGFDLFVMLLTLSHELGQEINQAARQQWPIGPQSRLVEALTRLHARACQIGYEIAALLRGGFSDGAMARWRTLHEVAVVFQFIARHGADTATRYLAHDAIDSRKGARIYNAMAARNGEKPFSASELADIEREADAAIVKYGPDFASEYGWSAHALNIRKPNFSEIERGVKLDHLRPFYKFASQNVHANPKGVLYRLGLLGDLSLLASGPSNVGLTDPAQHAALSIAQITAALANLSPSLETASVVAVLNEFPAEIGRAFWKTEKAIQADERKLRRASKNGG